MKMNVEERAELKEALLRQVDAVKHNKWQSEEEVQERLGHIKSLWTKFGFPPT